MSFWTRCHCEFQFRSMLRSMPRYLHTVTCSSYVSLSFIEIFKSVVVIILHLLRLFTLFYYDYHNFALDRYLLFHCDRHYLSAGLLRLIAKCYKWYHLFMGKLLSLEPLVHSFDCFPCDLVLTIHWLWVLQWRPFETLWKGKKLLTKSPTCLYFKFY